MQTSSMDPAVPLASPYSMSGVSWAAIWAGAAAAAALSLILIVLGFGLGFTAISPWSSQGMGATALSISAAIWLALTQIFASGLGGYLAGRLRVKWADVQSDEIYFRDTAHGLLSWAVASLVTAVLVGSVMGGLVGAGAQAASGVASSTLAMAQGATSSTTQDNEGEPLSYFVDALFRADRPTASDARAVGDDPKGEAMTILVHGMSTGTLDEQDKTYLARLVSERTGLNQADAEQRIDDLFAQAQQTVAGAKERAQEAADTARKAAAGAALWTFVALLCGAFFASLAAIWGGRCRDAAVLVPTRYEPL